MIDLHSHMLPGIDDGACDWPHSLEMARMAVEDGIEAVVCTPHWGFGVFDNTRLDILRVFELYQTRLREEQIALTVYPGSELRLNPDIPQRITDGTVLTLNDTGRYVLIELPHDSLPTHTSKLLDDLLSRGVVPILSHPERNSGFIRDPLPLYDMVGKGTLTQITAASLLGLFGADIQRFTTFLMEHGMAHVLATDAHGTKSRAPRLSKAYQEAERILGKDLAIQMVRDIPQKIVQGDSVQPFKLVEIGTARYLPLWKRAFYSLMPRRANGK